MCTLYRPKLTYSCKFVGENHSVDSVIYEWSETTRLFASIQNIETTGAYDWTYFSVNSYHFLAVANSFSGPPEKTTLIDSVLYIWQEGQFIQFQTLPVSIHIIAHVTRTLSYRRVAEWALGVR